jgi:peptidoglycan/xylan/chitin deacetylase (PgdA/CDA1 family)
MYLVKTPPLIKSIFSDFVWSVDTMENEVFITFDDGPVPGLTPWILDLLAEYQFKATFFCVGENVSRYPMIYNRILDEGHLAGNHTEHHLNGWLTDNETYLNDVKMCHKKVHSPLFRPPYGKMKRAQSNVLKTEKTIVMWDVLSGDFDQSISREKCLANVIDNYSRGSVIVFHDNLKAEAKLRYVLPLFLEELTSKDFISSNLECLTESYILA